MSDLVERLRATYWHSKPDTVNDALAEAATEIEQLRWALNFNERQMARATDEIEQLRADRPRPLDGWWWCETHELPTFSENGCVPAPTDGSDCGHLVPLYVGTAIREDQ